jgi:hypothetical protein
MTNIQIHEFKDVNSKKKTKFINRWSYEWTKGARQDPLEASHMLAEVIVPI